MSGIAHQYGRWPILDAYRDYLFDNHWNIYPRFADIWTQCPASLVLSQIEEEIELS